MKAQTYDHWSSEWVRNYSSHIVGKWYSGYFFLALPNFEVPNINYYSELISGDQSWKVRLLWGQEI
jgi:hypothetical protein